MHATARNLGGLLGGVIAIVALAMLWNKALTRRVGDGVRRQVVALIAAWVTAGVLGGFGFAHEGLFAWDAFTLYALPTLVAAPLLYLRARGRGRVR